MQRSLPMLRVVQTLVCLLVCKMLLSVILSYRDYFPANFHSDFLIGREAYFLGSYRWVFYVHIVAGPFVLLSGLVLLSDSVRRRFPLWHPRLGRIHVLCVLFAVAPSGLWMARYADTGAVAGIGFAVLAIATAYSAAKGWQMAIQRRFDEHRRWMQRCFALLCSAVVLRVIGGTSDILGAEWTYPLAAWVSWLLPLVVLESLRLRTQYFRLQQSSTGHAKPPRRFLA
jgi:hypothetical protein